MDGAFVRRWWIRLDRKHNLELKNNNFRTTNGRTRREPRARRRVMRPVKCTQRDMFLMRPTCLTRAYCVLCPPQSKRIHVM